MERLFSGFHGVDPTRVYVYTFNECGRVNFLFLPGDRFGNSAKRLYRFSITAASLRERERADKTISNPEMLHGVRTSCPLFEPNIERTLFISFRRKLCSSLEQGRQCEPQLASAFFHSGGTAGHRKVYNVVFFKHSFPMQVTIDLRMKFNLGRAFTEPREGHDMLCA